MYSLSLDVSPSGAGSVSPAGGKYLRGVQVTLTATPASGYRFANWTGDVGTVTNVNSASALISMSGDCSVTANFALDIIEIRDWYDLDAVRDNLNGSYLLMNDLDSTVAGYMELASKTANEGKGWQPIGTFTGSFNGQGHEIRDLFINRPGQGYVGLFAGVSWTHPIENVGLIENIGVVQADVTGGSEVGALVGHNRGIVNNSYSICSVAGTGWYVGGLVGYDDGGSVSNSHSSGNVTGEYHVGGLVGRIQGARTVRVGDVRNCYSTSSVTGLTRVGGLVGSTHSDASVSNSYFAGSVAGNRWVAGLVAENYGGNVSNSYSTGSVTGNAYVGGLVGLNFWGTLSSCYSTGTVSGDGHVGGMVGQNDEGTVSSSFWDTQTSGQSTSAGGTGKTTTEIKSIATFSGAGWNIVAVANIGTRSTACTWNIVDGQSYPFLSWQS
jgi:hypothetical protein